MSGKINRILKGELISSIFYVALGLCLILIPTQTVNVICKIVFGILMIGVGVYHIYIYTRGRETATIMDLLSGVVVLVLGFFLFTYPQIVVKLLPWLLGASGLVDSIWKFPGAYRLKKKNRGAWKLLLVGSLVFIVLGVVVITGFIPKMMTMLMFAGGVLLGNGVMDIIFYTVMKLSLRKARKLEESQRKSLEEKDGSESGKAGNTSENISQSISESASGQEEPQVSGEESAEKKDEILDEWKDGPEGEHPDTQEKKEEDFDDGTSEDRASDDKSSLGEVEGLTCETEEPAGIQEPEHTYTSGNDRWIGEPEKTEMSLKDFFRSEDDDDLEEWKD